MSVPADAGASLSPRWPPASCWPCRSRPGAGGRSGSSARRCSTGACATSPSRTRIWSGWLTGLGCFAIGLAWARAFNWYGALALVLFEALFFAVAAACTPPDRGRAIAFVGACTLAEAVRMAWPFGGLPLGGVFLGQADGPFLQLARLGGPLLMTAGVYAGGVALATLTTWARARAGSRPAPGASGRSPSRPASSPWRWRGRGRPTAATRCARCRRPWSRAGVPAASARRRSPRPRCSGPSSPP